MSLPGVVVVLSALWQGHARSNSSKKNKNDSNTLLATRINLDERGLKKGVQNNRKWKWKRSIEISI